MKLAGTNVRSKNNKCWCLIFSDPVYVSIAILYLPNTGFCFIHKNGVCDKIFDLGTGINFIFLHLGKQGSSWCLDFFGTGFHDQLDPYLLILKRSPRSCLGHGCWCNSIIFFTIVEGWLQHLLVCWFSSCLLLSLHCSENHLLPSRDVFAWMIYRSIQQSRQQSCWLPFTTFHLKLCAISFPVSLPLRDSLLPILSFLFRSFPPTHSPPLSFEVLSSTAFS